MGCAAGRTAAGGDSNFASTLAQAKGSKATVFIRRQLEAGLDVKRPDDGTGELPLASAVRLSVQLDGLEELLKAGASPTEPLEQACGSSSSRCSGQSALFGLLQDPRKANASPSRRDVAKMLLRFGLDANAVDQVSGGSLLLEAMKAGEMQLANDLLAMGAQHTATDHNGNSVLHAAAALADLSMVQLLLKTGLDPKAKNADGHSPVMCGRLQALAPQQRLSPARGWASKSSLSTKVFSKIEGHYFQKGEDVWTCPVSQDCWTAELAKPPGFPTNHEVAAMLALSAGDAYSLADAVEGAWLAGEAPPMRSMEETHPDIAQSIMQLVKVLQMELLAGMEARDRASLSAGLEMLRYANVAELPDEEPATRILVSLELEEAISSNGELELKQAIMSAQQYGHTSSKRYKQAQDALEIIVEAKRIEETARQLEDAVDRKDLETVYGLLQAGRASTAVGEALSKRLEFQRAEEMLTTTMRQELQKAVALCSANATRKACADAARYGLTQLPEFLQLQALRKSVCLQDLQEAASQKNESRLQELLGEVAGDEFLYASISKEKPFVECLQAYKDLLSLPAYFETHQVLNRVGKNNTVKRELEDEQLCAAFQELMDLTYRRVRTKDRRGDVPERLLVKKAVVVKNVPSFVEYMRRREEIRRQCASKPPQLLLGDPRSSGVCKTFLELPSGKGFHSVWREAHDLQSDPIDPSINEFYLFHGTKPEAATAITEGDFRLDLAGSNAGTLYGRGVYFSESTGKSDEYAQEDSRGLCCMLVCRVTLGRILYTDEEYPNPRLLVQSCVSGKTHSVLGDREKIRNTFREMIIYDTDQVYPEFLVWYERKQ